MRQGDPARCRARAFHMLMYTYPSLAYPSLAYPTPCAFHMPMYVMGDVTPGIAGTLCSFSRSCAVHTGGASVA